MKKIIHMENGRIRVQTINNQPTRTDQTQKDQCNINLIMRKFGNNMNNIPEPMKGLSGDFSQIPTFQQMQHVIIAADQSFQSLPAIVRKRFNNNPQEMIQFLEDKNNNEEAIKLGLKNKPQPKPEQTEAEKYYANQNANLKKASKQTQKTDSDD